MPHADLLKNQTLVSYSDAPSLRDSGVESLFWAQQFQTIQDCLEIGMVMDRYKLGVFITIKAECWSTSNMFVFQGKETNPFTRQRARGLVQGFWGGERCIFSF